MIKTPFTGGCLCGAIRYECNAQPAEIMMLKCHCRDCQRLSGGPYTPVVYFPERTFKFTQGTPRYHLTEGASGEHRRSFCPECGSRISGGQSPGGDGIGVTASSLDDPSAFVPSCELWVHDAQPWDPLLPGVPHFGETSPTE